MCVIMLAENERPDESMVAKGYLTNPHGAGIAWREGKGKDAVVKWKKGLELEELQKLVKTVSTPFVLHCRVPSIGGPSRRLNHPFTVDEKASLEFEGTTKGAVLFHNGTWSRWKEFSLDTAAKQPQKLPTGIWSDSRAMAWNASIYGLGLLEFLDEKVIVFSKDAIEIFGDPWEEVNGVLCSNKYWCNRPYDGDRAKGRSAAAAPDSVVGKTLGEIKREAEAKAKAEESGGTPRKEPFRTPGGDGRVEGRAFEQESVEEVSRNVYEADENNREGAAGSRVSAAVSTIGFTNSAPPKRNGTLEGDDLKQWALSLQPKGERHSSVVRMPVGDDSAERKRRLDNHRRGIQTLGRL